MVLSSEAVCEAIAEAVMLAVSTGEAGEAIFPPFAKFLVADKFLLEVEELGVETAIGQKTTRSRIIR